MLIGDDASAALNGAPCSIAIAPTNYSQQPGAIREIGVGYDGSPESQHALSVARSSPSASGAKLSALEAVSLPSDAFLGPGSVDNSPRRLLEDARGRIAALGGVEPRAAYGQPAEELALYSASVDLLMVRSRGYGPIGRLIHGSTSQQLAHSARCPLLVLARTARPARQMKRRTSGWMTAGCRSTHDAAAEPCDGSDRSRTYMPSDGLESIASGRVRGVERVIEDTLLSRPLVLDTPGWLPGEGAPALNPAGDTTSASGTFRLLAAPASTRSRAGPRSGCCARQWWDPASGRRRAPGQDRLPRSGHHLAVGQAHADSLRRSATEYEDQWFDQAALNRMLDAADRSPAAEVVWRAISTKLWLRNHWGQESVGVSPVRPRRFMVSGR